MAALWPAQQLRLCRHFCTPDTGPPGIAVPRHAPTGTMPNNADPNQQQQRQTQQQGAHAALGNGQHAHASSRQGQPAAPAGATVPLAQQAKQQELESKPLGPSDYELAAERMTDPEILSTLAGHLWPKGVTMLWHVICICAHGNACSFKRGLCCFADGQALLVHNQCQGVRRTKMKAVTCFPCCALTCGNMSLQPSDNPEFKRRIAGALGLLIGSKVLNVQVRGTLLPCR